MTRKIISVVDDMFFASKIRATAEALNIEISFARAKDALLEKTRLVKPDLILIDLHNQRFDPSEFVSELKNDAELKSIPVLGFFSHMEVEVQRRAIAAGFDRVVPRSVFARELPRILEGVSDVL